jgi:hypothetical protein
MSNHKREITIHRKALERIACSPSKVGIKDDIVGVWIEGKLYDIRKGKRVLIAEPDVTFYTVRGGIIIVEYKNNGNGVEKAREQLETARVWYAKYTPTPLDQVRTMIIHGDEYPFLKR